LVLGVLAVGKRLAHHLNTTLIPKKKKKRKKEEGGRRKKKPSKDYTRHRPAFI
jgi:hypothetical protein